MSAPAPFTPAADGGTADVDQDPASDRRRIVNNEANPPSNSEDGPEPSTDAAPDRRKVIHQSPSADSGTGGSEDGPAPDHTAPPPDRRKIIHREPSAESEDPPTPHDPPSRDGDESHGSVCCELPDARRQRAEAMGGIQANGTEIDAVATMDSRSKSRGVGTRLVETVRAAAVTLMLLAMIGSAAGAALPAHHADDGHGHEVEHVGDVQEASLTSGLYSLWALAVAGWSALASPDICGDCNLPADDGCKCVCYSGGYDPDDPACQF